PPDREQHAELTYNAGVLVDTIVLPDAPRPATPRLVNQRIGEGQRNTALTRIAGALRRQGLEHHELDVVLQPTNAAICDPPLDDREVLRVVKSVGRYPAGSDKPRQGEAQPSIATQLVEFASDWKYLRTPYGEGYYHRNDETTCRPLSMGAREFSRLLAE